MKKIIGAVLAMFVLLGGCGKIAGASGTGAEVSSFSQGVMASGVSAGSTVSGASPTSQESDISEDLADDYGVTATREDAPGVFCRFFFGKELFTGWWDALSDFSIKDITLLDGGDEDTIRFRVQYTVTPARYAEAFSWYNPFAKGQYGNMKPSEVTTAEVTLVNDIGLWMPVRDTLPKIHDMDDSHEPTSEYLGSSGLMHILLETDRYTYFSEAHLVVDKDGKCKETKTMVSVYAYRHSDKQVIPVIVDREDRQFWVMDRVGDTIVFGSNWICPESEPCRSALFVLDESTLTFKELPAVGYLAFIDQGFFYAEDYEDLRFYDYKSGKVTAYPEAQLSYGDDAYWYGGNMFCYNSGKVIWDYDPDWTSDDYKKGNTKWFALDQTTGKVSEYVWK